MHTPFTPVINIFGFEEVILKTGQRREQYSCGERD
jgi:hypothetical protein